MNKPTAFLSWSGGKDSALCLHRVLQQDQYNIHTLLTNMNSAHNRISMHGIRRGLLQAQVQSMGMPLQTVELPEQPAMAVYEEKMNQKVAELKNSGCTHGIFGDLFLEDLKCYREEQARQQGLEAVFPLWKQDTNKLLQQFFDAGFKAMVVAVNGSLLHKSFCGRPFDESFLNDLPAGVDPCGENGEFHTFVFDGPLFKHPVAFSKGVVTEQTYKAPDAAASDCFEAAPPAHFPFYFCDLLPA